MRALPVMPVPWCTFVERHLAGSPEQWLRGVCSCDGACLPALGWRWLGLAVLAGPACAAGPGAKQ